MGIYVRTGDHERVVAAIKRYWLAVGAKELDAAEQPLPKPERAVKRNGKLGYWVFPATPDHDGFVWVTVHDSEGERQGAELARVLAEELDVLVVSNGNKAEDGGDAGAAHQQVFRGASPQERWAGESEDEEEMFMATFSLPHCLVDYAEQCCEIPVEEMSLFGFAEMPYRQRGYRGPSEEELREAAMLERVAAATVAGDVATVRMAYDAEVQYRAGILHKVLERKPRGFWKTPQEAAQVGGWRVMLAMAEELMSNPDQSWLVCEAAIAAFWTGERALFQRAVQLLGQRTRELEWFGRDLVKAEDFDRAIEVLRVVAGNEEYITTVNLLAQAVLAARQLPSDAAELLARCEAHGMANPEIFHSTARAWLRVGDPERALAAVRQAVNAGYLALEKLRDDETLAPLAHDPRFWAALENGSTATAKELVITRSLRGQPYVMRRPVMRFDFFLEPQPMAQSGAAAAALLEAYLADIPPGAVVKGKRNGPWRELTREVVAEDLCKLRAAQAGDWICINYRGAFEGHDLSPTEYGLYLYIRDEPNPDEHEPVPTLSVWFPAELADGDVDVVAARYARYAALMATEAGGAGLHVMLRYAESAGDPWWGESLFVIEKDQFLGTETHPWRESSKGKSAGAMWLTYLGAPLVAELGGRAALAAQVAPAVVEEVERGAVIIRASLRPGLGIGPSPRDLGALPKVARAVDRLTPRYHNPSWNLQEHYQRLFKVQVMAYENGPPVVADPQMRAAEAAAKDRMASLEKGKDR